MAKTLHAALSDEELLLLVKQEDKIAFSEIFKRYWPQLLDRAYRRLDSIELAEEMVQDIFVSIYHKRGEIEITSSLAGYLNSALKYKILNHIRGEIVRNNYRKMVESSEVCYSPDVTEKMDEKELRQEIDECLDLLPAKCRQVFVLSREDNLSHKQIACMLGISVSTVEKHIVKALKIMRSNLKEYHFELILIASSFFFL